MILNFARQLVSFSTSDVNRRTCISWLLVLACLLSALPAHKASASIVENDFHIDDQTLVYDEQSRLRQVDDVYYFYNDAGERVRKTRLGVETVWIDDIYEREWGWRTLCHVEAAGKRIVTFSADASEFYYYHGDHLGSSSLMTDQTGSFVSQQYGYRAFGSERYSLSFWPSFTSRFTGQPYDVDTGLYYYQSRYYDPELGRFIQPDSIVPNPNSSQSLNRYSYVLNNPLKYTDPTGHWEEGSSWGLPSFGYSASYDYRYQFFGMPRYLPPDAGGILGFGAGSDWLGLGWGAGGYRTSELPSSLTDPYALWDDSPNESRQLSFKQEWKYDPVGQTLLTAVSVGTMALPFGGPIARATATARVGASFPVTRMAPAVIWRNGWRAMKTASEIKNQLRETLVEVLDQPLKAVGFARNKRSLVYCRSVNGTEHRITFIVHCHPKYQPGAEAHIYPSLQVLMPQVSETALALVNGDKWLLADAPEIIIGEPIEFTAPKDKHQRWFATGKEQFAAACESIQGFLAQWVLPFLSEVSTPVDLINLHEANDERIVKSKKWHIFIAAAYQVIGQLDKARDVVRKQFGRPGLRRLYAPVFKSLAIE